MLTFLTLGVIMLLSGIMLVRAEYYRGSLFFIYALGLFLIILLPMVYDMGVAALSADGDMWVLMSRVGVYVILFNALFYITRQVTASVSFPHEMKAVVWENPLKEKATTVFIWCLPVMAFTLNMAAYDFSIQNMLSSSWLDSHGSEGRVANELKDILLCVIPGGFTYFIIQGRKRMAILYALVILVLAVLDRTRGSLLGILANWAFLMLIHYRVSPHKGRLIFWYLLAAVGVVALFIGIQLVRYAGALANLIEFMTWDRVWPVLQKRLGSRDSELQIIGFFYQIIDNDTYVWAEHTYSNIRRMIFILDITHLFKPDEDMPKELWNAYKPTDLKPGEGSLHPTIYGISWLDGGWGGLIYAPFMATLFSGLEWFCWRISRLHPCWFFVLGPLGYIAAFTARGSVYVATWSCFAGLILSCLLVFLLKHFCAFEEEKVSKNIKTDSSTKKMHLNS